MDNIPLTIFLGIFGGGSLVALIEFLVKRHDKKKGKDDVVVQELKSIKTDIADLRTDVETRFDTIDRKVDDSAAIQARARILRFNDEVQTGRSFSHSAWSQTFEDISYYEKHCNKYDDFPNAKADDAISNLKIVHKELLVKERNGEKVFI